MGGKNLDTKSHVKNGLSGCILQAGLYGSELLSSLREVNFSHQEFATSTLISNIKYNHSRFQKITLFIPFMISLTMD